MSTTGVASLQINPNNQTYPLAAVVKFQATAVSSSGVMSTPSVTWTATGGTITSSGTYVGGTVAGKYRVIAKVVGSTLADTSSITLSSTAATLLALQITPKTITVTPGAYVDYSFTPVWSVRTDAPPSVTYSTTGGTITGTGIYRAPSTTGVFKVVVKDLGSPIADTATVTVSGVASPAPPAWLNEDFTTYTGRTQMMSDPNHFYSVTEDANPGQITLDQTDGCGAICGVASGRPIQSMRYDIPNRTTDPNICHDYTIGRNIQFPSGVQDAWIEVWAKFSSNFTTVVPGNICTSSAGYKFILPRVYGSSRFNLIAGVFGTSMTWGYPDHEQAYNGGPFSASYFDGQWHRWRFHTKVGLAGIATAYLDNTKISQIVNVAINRSGIYGIALSRNMNQGPTQAISLKYGAVRVWRSDPGWGF